MASIDQVFCVLDYETRSKAEIRKTGAFEYARHPSTQLLCVAWRIGTRETLPAAKTESWSPALPGPYGSLKRALLDPAVKLVAHNAGFEQVITRFVLTKLIHDPRLAALDHDRWVCTASLARALALPGKLEEACKALRLPVQKDMTGHRLMMKMSKPRKPTKTNPAVWYQKKADLARLMEYCRADVDAEVALLLRLPELNPLERKVWLLDQKINFRGILVDRPLVKKVLGMIKEESARFERETVRITGGEVASTAQRDATLRWLAANGLSLPDLRAKTVADVLASGLASGKAADLLAIRANASKTSTAKYEAFEARSRSDGRVRDNLVYHTASTGRWGGAGVQPQNFPRGTVSNTDQAAEILSDPATDLELVRLLYGNPLDVFSSCLRSMIIASPGKRLIGGDYAGIEARVLFWVAKYEDGLRIFRDGRDIYKEMAAIIFNIPVERVTKKQRQLGKVAILGLGYGMGKDKFFDTCKSWGIEVDPELAAAAVQAYRSTHYPVTRLWSNIDQAALAAVANRGKRYTINRTSWWVEGDFLFCELPSKRRLSYPYPEIRFKVTPWGEKKPTLYHYGVEPMTRKWVCSGTYGGRLTENIVQAIARDLMAEGLIRLEDAGNEMTLSVHDEGLGERDFGAGSVSEFERLMATLPEWGTGLPVNVEGWEGNRYKK